MLEWILVIEEIEFSVPQVAKQRIYLFFCHIGLVRSHFKTLYNELNLG